MFVKTLEDGRTHVELSYSSLSTWRQCPMLGFLQYKHELGGLTGTSGGPSPAAALGSGIHVAAPHWSLTGDLEAAFEKFDETFTVPLESETDWYSRDRGHAILRTYAKRYAGKDGRDTLSIVHLNDNPQVEIKSTITIVDKPDLLVTLVVILDQIVIDPEERGVWVKDMKTTGSPIGIASPWFQAQANSDQWIGYVLDAKERYEDILKVPVLGVLIDAIYTRRKVIAPDDMQRHYLNLVDDIPIEARAAAFKVSVEHTARNIVKWWNEVESPPTHTAWACTLYNRACRFLPVCKASTDLMNMALARKLYSPYERS